METVIYVNPDLVRQFIVDLFGHYKVSKADAGVIADNLIDAEIRGISTHGLTRIPLYTEKITSGLCDPCAQPTIVKNFGATALVDAHHGLGQVGATRAMEMAIDKAAQYGIGFVGLKNGSHYGTAGYYAMMAVKNGMIGFSSTNSGVFVAPFGGIEKRLGTNPVAIALPSCGEFPLLLDMATSKVARGKLLVAMKKKEPVPPGWALQADGTETTDAEKAFHGILLPLGYKGYGLAVMVDMLSGVLMDSGFGKTVDTPDGHPVVGSNFMAIRIDAFMDPDIFRERADALAEEIRNVKLAPGTDRVYMPGEIEFRIEAENRKNGGLPVQHFQIRELNEQAAPFGFTFDEYMQR